MQKLLLPELKEIDPHAYIIPASGQGLEKGDYRLPNLNIVVEGKNWARISVQGWMEQSKKEGLGPNKSIIIFKNPKSASEEEKDFWAVVNFYDLQEWLKIGRQPLIEKPDREFRWKLERLKQAINQVLKDV